MKKIYFLVLAFIVLLFCLLYNNTYEGFESILNPGESNVASEQPLIDATRDNPPWNQGLNAGADLNDQDIGSYTVLDKMFHMDSLNNQGKNYKKIKKMESKPKKSTKIGTVGNGFVESASKKFSNLFKTEEEEKKEEIISEKQKQIQASIRKMLSLEDELNKELWEEEEKDRFAEEIKQTKENIKQLTIESLKLNDNIDIKNISNQVLQSEIDSLLTTESDREEQVRLQELVKEINEELFKKINDEKKTYNEEQESLKKKEQDELNTLTIICNSKDYTGYSGDCFDKCFKKYESEMTDKKFKMCYTKFSENDKIDGAVYLHPNFTAYWNGNNLKKKDLNLESLNNCVDNLDSVKTGFYLDDNNDCSEVDWKTIEDAKDESSKNNFVFFKPVDCVGSFKPDDCPKNTGIQKFQILSSKRHFGKDCDNKFGELFDCGALLRKDCSNTEWIVDTDKIEERKEAPGQWWKRFKRTYIEQTYGGKECTDEQKKISEWRSIDISDGYYVNDDGMGVTMCKEGDDFFCENGKKKSCADTTRYGGDKKVSKDKATSKSDCKVPINPGFFYDAGEIKKCTPGSYCLGGYETSWTPCSSDDIPMTSPEGSSSYAACREIECSPGEYWVSPECKPCPKNTYCPGTRNATTATAIDCPDDKKTKNTGSTLISDCKEVCPAGKYWNGTECVECTEGNYCEGGYQEEAIQKSCGKAPSSFKADKYETTKTGATSKSDCKIYCGPTKFFDESTNSCKNCVDYPSPSKSGSDYYYCSGGWENDPEKKFGVKKCPSGKGHKDGVSIGQAMECKTKCNPGQYLIGGSCSSQCEEDHYCLGGFDSVKTKCPSGKTTYGIETAYALSACKELCQAGKYWNGSTCKDCGYTYYCEGGQHRERCGAGTVTSGGNLNAKKKSECHARQGFYYKSNNFLPCLANHYCSGGSVTMANKWGIKACASGKTVAEGQGKTEEDCKSVVRVATYPPKLIYPSEWIPTLQKRRNIEYGNGYYMRICGLKAINKTRLDNDSANEPSYGAEDSNYGFDDLKKLQYAPSWWGASSDSYVWNNVTKLILQASVGDKIKFTGATNQRGKYSYKIFVQYYRYRGFWAWPKFEWKTISYSAWTKPSKLYDTRTLRDWTVPSTMSKGKYVLKVSHHYVTYSRRNLSSPNSSIGAYTSARLYTLHIV